jgi:putative transposase
MTETLVGVNPPSSKDPADPPSPEELAAAKELVRQASAQGVALTGPGGLLKALTKTVLETALEEEMAEHLGYDKHDPVGRNRGNSRNGKRAKTVLTDSGEVAVEVPRDRDGSFEPVIVAKRQRRLSRIDEIVLSLYARGLTTGDIAAHFAEIYAAQVSKDTISRITSRSATARSLTGPSMPRSGSTWKATRTSWACGSATAAGSRQSFGCGGNRAAQPRCR